MFPLWCWPLFHQTPPWTMSVKPSPPPPPPLRDLLLYLLTHRCFQCWSSWWWQSSFWGRWWVMCWWWWRCLPAELWEPLRISSWCLWLQQTFWWPLWWSPSPWLMRWATQTLSISKLDKNKKILYINVKHHCCCSVISKLTFSTFICWNMKTLHLQTQTSWMSSATYWQNH